MNSIEQYLSENKIEFRHGIYNAYQRRRNCVYVHCDLWTDDCEAKVRELGLAVVGVYPYVLVMEN